MVARCAGASLGLLAFSITTVAGLYAGNGVLVTLSRSLLALFLFCVIGLLLGRAAGIALAEHERSRRTEIQKRYHENAVPTGLEDGPTGKPFEVGTGR